MIGQSKRITLNMSMHAVKEKRRKEFTTFKIYASIYSLNNIYLINKVGWNETSSETVLWACNSSESCTHNGYNILQKFWWPVV